MKLVDEVATHFLPFTAFLLNRLGRSKHERKHDFGQKGLGPVKGNLEVFKFPVIAFSPTGWAKEADEIRDLADASPNDDLSDWQGLEIYDSSGLKYTARRVYRLWPASCLGVLVCRLSNLSIHVDMDLDDPCAASLDELKHRVILYYGNEPALRGAVSHEELITQCL